MHAAARALLTVLRRVQLGFEITALLPFFPSNDALVHYTPHPQCNGRRKRRSRNRRIRRIRRNGKTGKKNILLRRRLPPNILLQIAKKVRKKVNLSSNFMLNDFSKVRADADSLLTLPNERNNFSPISSSLLPPFSTRSSFPNYQYRKGIIYVNLLSNN
jgi:hypothetical protein